MTKTYDAVIRVSRKNGRDAELSPDALFGYGADPKATA